MQEEAFETEYGVVEMVREHQKAYKNTYTKFICIGVGLCILSVIPLLAGSFLTEDIFVLTCTVVVLLLLCAIGVWFFIVSGVCWASYETLLQEGDLCTSFFTDNRR